MQHEWEACEICTEFQLGNRVRKKLLGRPRLRWEDIIGILKIQSGVCRLDSVVFRYGSLISSFEYGNETQDSIGAQRFCYRLGYGTVFVTGGSWCLCIQRRRRFPPEGDEVYRFFRNVGNHMASYRNTASTVWQSRRIQILACSTVSFRRIALLRVAVNVIRAVLCLF